VLDPNGSLVTNDLLDVLPAGRNKEDRRNRREHAAQGVLGQQRVDGGDGDEGVVGPHQPLGCEDVDVGMEGEVLAERLPESAIGLIVGR